MAVFVRGDSLKREKTLIPPMTPGLELTVKYADNRAVVLRQNLFDTVRYIQRIGDEETVTERRFPMGDLRIRTIELVLVRWNNSRAADAPPIPITEDTILDELSPEEFEWLYNQILEMNPVWGGVEGEKSDSSDTGTTD